MTAEWCTYNELGQIVTRHGDNEYAAKEEARVCGVGIDAVYRVVES